MLEGLFGNATIEKALFFLLANKNTYATQLALRFDKPLNSFQQALARLEKGGIIVGLPAGRTRLYQFNPRYPFLNELKALIKAAYKTLPQEMKENYYEPPLRKRPRRLGKPLTTSAFPEGSS